MTTAIIVFAHGSSVPEANDAVRKVARDMAKAGGFDLVDTAFLEAAQPDLSSSVEHVVKQGANHVVVVPYFLTLGIHLRRDLPRLVGELADRIPGVSIQVTEPLDGHPALSQILLERAQRAIIACKATPQN